MNFSNTNNTNEEMLTYNALLLIDSHGEKNDPI